MHPDLSSHLHTSECNVLISQLHQCHQENGFSKFFGACNTADRLVQRCIQEERKKKMKINRENALQKQAAVRERITKSFEK